jgi:putative AlgH/UPF0301 family transcriptional regulator
VGWRPGELAKEMEAGYWYTAEPDASLFFRPDTSGLWKELLERVGGNEAPRAQGMRTASLSLIR